MSERKILMRELFEVKKYNFYNDIHDELRQELDSNFLDMETGNFIEPLVDIIVHKSNLEIFLVLQGEERLQEGKIEQFIKDWEDRVMSFINFSDVPEYTNKMRYDIQLLVLYEKVNENQYKDDILKIEKSSRNCRKIFIPLENGEITDEGKVFLTNTVLDFISSNGAEVNYRTQIDNMIQKFNDSGIEIYDREERELTLGEKKKLRRWVDQYNDN